MVPALYLNLSSSNLYSYAGIINVGEQLLTLNAKPATCTADVYSGDEYCSDCGELLKTGTVIKAKGHTGQ